MGLSDFMELHCFMLHPYNSQVRKVFYRLILRKQQLNIVSDSKQANTQDITEPLLFKNHNQQQKG